MAEIALSATVSLSVPARPRTKNLRSRIAAAMQMNGRLPMYMRRKCLLFVAASPASGAHGAAPPIPDFSGVWTHPAFPWFEPPASGPGPITNLSRPPVQRPETEGGSAALPASEVGISNYDKLVGNYKSPILQPWAAAAVKKFGEMSLAGITFPNPSNQCWPSPMPFIYKLGTIQMMQQPDRITILYGGYNNEVRRCA
jgi:hypothetical protein